MLSSGHRTPPRLTARAGEYGEIAFSQPYRPRHSIHDVVLVLDSEDRHPPDVFDVSIQHD